MAKGRPRQYNPDEALEAAMLVFWQKGYQSTSLSDLLEATHLSKSSLYQGYGSKRDLFLKCLELFRHQTASDLARWLERSENGKAFVEYVLNWVIDEAKTSASPKGCLLVNTTTEFSQLDPGVASKITVAFDTYKSIFQQGVERGQADGSIRSDQPADHLAGYLVMGMSGLRTMVKAGTPHDVLQNMVKTLIETVA